MKPTVTLPTKREKKRNCQLTTNGGGLFVGCFERKVNNKGAVRLPKCWLAVLGNSKRIYCVRSGRRALSIFAENEFVQCDDGVKRKAVALLVNPSGCVKLEGVVPGSSCANKTVVMHGRLRYIQVEVIIAKANSRYTCPGSSNQS